MHRRVRWENVIRVAGAGLLLAMVVAWPRLAPREPEFPATEATPLVGDEPLEVSSPPRVPERAAGQRVRERARRDASRRRDGRSPRERERRGGRSRAQERGGSRPRRKRDRPGPAGSDGSGPATGGDGQGSTHGGGSAPTAAPPRDPAQTEFGFERG